MTVPFGQQNEQFKSSLFLVLGNRIMTCFVAVACLLVRVATSDELLIRLQCCSHSCLLRKTSDITTCYACFCEAHTA